MARKGSNPPVRNRALVTAKMLQVCCRIMELDYDLSLKMHDRIEVKTDGKLAVIILTGTSMTI